MANDVKFAIPERKIGNTGVTLSRMCDGHKHGDIRIRQNSIDWRPSGNEFLFEVSWELFARFAQENGKRIKPKTTLVHARKKLTPPPSSNSYRR